MSVNEVLGKKTKDMTPVEYRQAMYEYLSRREITAATQLAREAGSVRGIGPHLDDIISMVKNGYFKLPSNSVNGIVSILEQI